MEIKAKLEKPYTERKRLDFIVENNHNSGYVIKEDEFGLEAWGLEDSEILERARRERINEIKQELEDLDLKTIRPLRAKEDDILEELETKAKSLREELKELLK